MKKTIKFDVFSHTTTFQARDIFQIHEHNHNKSPHIIENPCITYSRKTVFPPAKPNHSKIAKPLKNTPNRKSPSNETPSRRQPNARATPPAGERRGKIDTGCSRKPANGREWPVWKAGALPAGGWGPSWRGPAPSWRPYSSKFGSVKDFDGAEAWTRPRWQKAPSLVRDDGNGRSPPANRSRCWRACAGLNDRGNVHVFVTDVWWILWIRVVVLSGFVCVFEYMSC